MHCIEVLTWVIIKLDLESAARKNIHVFNLINYKLNIVDSYE